MARAGLRRALLLLLCVAAAALESGSGSGGGSSRAFAAVGGGAPTRLSYPVEFFPQGNRTVFAVELQGNGFLQIVGLGVDGQLWHAFQRADGAWEDWSRLTTACPSALEPARPCRFDGDPAIARNRDGRLEVFARFAENLDVWQMHQTDAADPSSWSRPREGSCVDQDQTTAVWSCLAPGTPDKQSLNDYWIIDSPVFSTSDLTVIAHPEDGRIILFFRNFEGHMYRVEQRSAGNSTHYTMPILVTDKILFM
jgi:hypothetical protein